MPQASTHVKNALTILTNNTTSSLLDQSKLRDIHTELRLAQENIEGLQEDFEGLQKDFSSANEGIEHLTKELTEVKEKHAIEVNSIKEKLLQQSEIMKQQQKEHERVQQELLKTIYERDAQLANLQTTQAEHGSIQVAHNKRIENLEEGMTSHKDCMDKFNEALQSVKCIAEKCDLKLQKLDDDASQQMKERMATRQERATATITESIQNSRSLNESREVLASSVRYLSRIDSGVSVTSLTMSFDEQSENSSSSHNVDPGYSSMPPSRESSSSNLHGNTSSNNLTLNPIPEN